MADPEPTTPAKKPPAAKKAPARKPAAKRPDAKDRRIAALEAQVAEQAARIAALEAEIVEQGRATNALVSRSQEKLYWLERWQVDLDALMRRPGAVPALEALRSLRHVVRLARKGVRRLRGA